VQNIQKILYKTSKRYKQARAKLRANAHMLAHMRLQLASTSLSTHAPIHTCMTVNAAPAYNHIHVCVHAYLPMHAHTRAHTHTHAPPIHASTPMQTRKRTQTHHGRAQTPRPRIARQCPDMTTCRARLCSPVHRLPDNPLWYHRWAAPPAHQLLMAGWPEL